MKYAIAQRCKIYDVLCFKQLAYQTFCALINTYANLLCTLKRSQLKDIFIDLLKKIHFFQNNCGFLIHFIVPNHRKNNYFRLALTAICYLVGLPIGLRLEFATNVRTPQVSSPKFFWGLISPNW